jgi:dolichol-phosphate mannosyltransferase
VTSAIVIVPTYNERANVPVLIAGLMQHKGVRVLVVDDQSPDGTADVVEALAPQYEGRVSVLRRTGKRGFGRSYLEGIERSLKEPVDVLCQMDADLSHDPRDLPALIDAVANQGADLAIGSRYISGGAIVNWPLRRLILSRFANIYVRTITGLSPHDCTSGYRCWRRSVLASLPLNRLVSDGYSFIVEILFLAARDSRRIVEVPITFVERREGESKISRAVVLESAIMPWKLIARHQAP